MAGSILQALIGIILIALTSGINTALSSTFWAEYYGTRYLGEVKSISSAMMVIGSAIGPGLSGLLIDLKFDFTKQILGIVILTIFSTITNIYALKRAKLLLMRKT
jgi:MFS family permease